MMHLAYFGIGLVAAFLVAIFPALLSFGGDNILWWFGGKEDRAPRLTKDYGVYWLSGLVIMVMLGGMYGAGILISKYLFHMV